MSIFRALQQAFKIKRENTILSNECYGTYGENSKCIVFDYDSDIQKGDIVIDSHESFVITKIISQKADEIPKEMWNLEAYIQTEDEYYRQNESRNTFNINNCSINGVLQNNKGNVNINNGISLDDLRKMIDSNNTNDKEELSELVKELEKAENYEMYKKGLLSKFSHLLNKYSWLSGAVANYLIPKIFGG